jgi:hypothetical protein
VGVAVGKSVGVAVDVSVGTVPCGSSFAQTEEDPLVKVNRIAGSVTNSKANKGKTTKVLKIRFMALSQSENSIH